MNFRRLGFGRGARPAGSGFSLVELLVALAVVAVLAALAFPALQRAAEKTRTSRDAGNLRQIGAGLLMFAVENGGRLPEAGAVIPWGTTGENGLPPWTEQIAPYLGGKREVFISPLGHLDKSEPGYFLGSHPAQASFGVFGPVFLLRMESPSQTLLAGTIGSREMFPRGDWDPDDYAQSPAFDESRRSRLAPAINIVFADGHVRACAIFDTNSMTTQYERGRWYSF